ncbi:uL11 family ribosomal protein [Amycolatopsis aidingensis]|uniref:uL11 family ribosomal protein n=1 Tax=Amycolatopsis aidingensis TaxID=2842453 RepID=UPI001C0DF06C|nr:50S ribosomal protein L11 [Amycolatopsis aidingensis]
MSPNKQPKKAKKLSFQATLELTAGDAPVVDLGKMLGQTGVNLVEVKRAYDAATANQRGDVVPAVVAVFEDRSFELRLKTPPTAFLIRKALGGKGSSRPGHEGAGTLSAEQLREIAERKLPDLNTADLDAAMRTIAGTARSMGVTVRPPESPVS